MGLIRCHKNAGSIIGQSLGLRKGVPPPRGGREGNASSRRWGGSINQMSDPNGSDIEATLRRSHRIDSNTRTGCALAPGGGNGSARDKKGAEAGNNPRGEDGSLRAKDSMSRIVFADRLSPNAPAVSPLI